MMNRPFGKTAEVIAQAKAFSDAGLTVAFNCPDSQEDYFRKLFADYPFVEVNPETRPEPQKPLVWFDEASAFSEKQMKAIQEAMER